MRELAHYPSAIAGLVIIGVLVGLAIYAVIAIPYGEAVRLWRGGERLWRENPRNAWPSWVNLLPGIDLPRTIVLDSRDRGVAEEGGGEGGRGEGDLQPQPLPGGLWGVELSLPFDYKYGAFPSELVLFFDARYRQRPPHLSLSWVTPDGREIEIGQRRAVAPYRLSLDRELAARLEGLPPEVGLFVDPKAANDEAKGPVPLKGRYELRARALLFEEDSQIDLKLVIYGRVHGWAGTDHRRRDLVVALLWGTPIALAFGLLGAVGATVSTFIIAAIGVWFGRWVDGLIQRITEVNMILPVLPILIMIGTFYSRSIWVMLGAIIALGVFSAGIKTYRAMFLQVKELPYIEAALAYGARSFRIIFRYMLPRLIPVLIPSFVMAIPGMVFLEASLALLGLGDPVLPTWGKVLYEALREGALYKGYYYWMLEPAALLMVTGLGFTMIGYALDRIFNPKLREL